MVSALNITTGVDEQITKVVDSGSAPVSGEFPFAVDERFEYCLDLGQGGCGRVCLVYDHILQRQVALKFILGQLAGHTAVVLQEARAQAQVRHQHICQIYEACEYEQHIYSVMQYVKGHRLAIYLPNSI